MDSQSSSESKIPAGVSRFPTNCSFSLMPLQTGFLGEPERKPIRAPPPGSSSDTAKTVGVYCTSMYRSMVAVLAVIVLLAAPVTSTRTYHVVLAAKEMNVVGEPLTVKDPPPVMVRGPD